MPSATRRRMRNLIKDLQEHGVSFKVDDDFLKDMEGEGASQEVLEAIRKAPYHEATGGAHSAYQKTAAQTSGDPDQAFAEAEVVLGRSLWRSSHRALLPGDSWLGLRSGPTKIILLTHISTQNVSGIRGADGRAAEGSSRQHSQFIRTTSAAVSAASSPQTVGTSPRRGSPRKLAANRCGSCWSATRS